MSLDRNLRSQSGESRRRRAAGRAVRHDCADPDADAAHARGADSDDHGRNPLARRQPAGSRAGDRHRAGGAAHERRGHHEAVVAEHGLARRDHHGVRRRHRHGRGAAQGQQPAAAGARVSRRRRRAGDQHVRRVEPVHRLVHFQPEVRDAGGDRRVRERSIRSSPTSSPSARKAHNMGVRVLRLRELAAEASGSQASCCRRRTSTSPRCGASPRTRSRPASSACPACRSRPRSAASKTSCRWSSIRKSWPPGGSRSPTSATCSAARTKTPRPATSGKASAAGSSARWASSARPSRSRISCWRSATARRCSSATWPRCASATRSPTASSAASASRASPSTPRAKPAPTCST